MRHATFSTDGRRIESRDVSIPFQFEKLILGNYIYATGSAFRKSLWERVGGYDKRFEVFEDWDFIIRAAQSGRFHHLPVVSGESRKFTGIAAPPGAPSLAWRAEGTVAGCETPARSKPRFPPSAIG
ncbi:MAG TPA: hypothetical protein VJA66_03435 [Thermoanaerobaculia bacterium]